mgnify:CR=1 FL=1|jgi:hypothetical protein|uniref:Uncharacterized protein n=1 Tax=Myoviridae sp. ctgsk7 TaxID=2825151 RepID=A0A8S5PY31_9CAUD|nr:MAG TPA: hypothetical protein [Myoviridae sp. ctgsk7]
MDNTYDILNQILGVVSRIESNSKKDSKVDSSKSKNDSTKGDSQKLFSGSKNPLNFAGTGKPESLQKMGTALLDFSKGLGAYMKIRLLGGKAAMVEISNFMASLQNIDLRKMYISANAVSALTGLLSVFTPKNVFGVLMLSHGLKDKDDIQKFLVALTSGLNEIKDPNDFESKARTLTRIILLLSDKKIIQGLKRASALNEKRGKNIADFMIALTKGLMAIPNIEVIDQATLALKTMTQALKQIVICVGIIVAIGALLYASESPWAILGITGALLIGIIGILHIVVKEMASLKNSKDSLDSMTRVLFGITGVVTAMVAVAALVLMIDHPLVILGITAALLLGIIGMLAAVVGLSSEVKASQKSLANITKALVQLNLVLVGLLAVSVLLTMLKNPLEIVGITALLLVAVVGTLWAVSRMSSGISKSTAALKNLSKAMISITACLVILVGIAVLLSLLKNPLEVLAITGALILAEIAIVLAVGFAGKMLRGSHQGLKQLYLSIIAVTACISLVLLLAIVINSLKEPYEVLKIAGIILGGMIGMLVLVAIVDKIFDLAKVSKSLMYLAAGVFLMTVVFSLLLICLSLTLIPLIQKINETANFLEGLAGVAAVVIGMGIITFLLGALLNNENMLWLMAKGAVGILALTGIIWLLSGAVDELVNVSLKIGAQTGAFWKGFGSIAGVLIIVTVIIGVLGAVVTALAPIMAVGAASMLALAGIIYALGKGFDPLVDVSLKIGNQSKVFWKGLKEIAKVLSGLVVILGVAGILSPLIAASEAVFLPLGFLMIKLSKGLDSIIDVSIKVGEQKDEFWKGLKGIGEVISTLLDSLSDVSLASAIKLPIITRSLVPLFESLGMFVDIINKMETQTFLKGYDSNGKPIFEKIDVDYKTAATTIGNNFLDFVRTLIPIIDDLDSDSVKLIKKLGGALQPMMDSLSKYVDIILKMADPNKLSIIEGYDEKGNPKYGEKKIDIKLIATNIGDSFIAFVTELDNKFENINKDSAKRIERIGNALGPIMEVLSSYTEAMEKISDQAKTALWIVSATALSTGIISVLKLFMEKKFNDDVSKYYGGRLQRSQFSKIKNSLDDILETYKSFGSILKMATNENIQNAKNSLVLGKYLSAFVYQITQGNLLAYTKDVKSKEYEKITSLLKSIYPSAIYIEKLGKMDMSNVENNTMSFINALNNFAKLDLANNATTVLKNSIIFDRALSRIDQALTKNKKARLAAMKEFSAGAVQMAESIDKVSKSVSNITNKDKQDLEFVINQLKEIEKTRLEETTIKLEYERAKEANLAQQTAEYANQVQADNKEFASNILNKTNNVRNNTTQGMLGGLSQEHLDVIVKYFSDEITQAIITGLTTGIKKFELIFKNSSEVVGGQLAIGK